MSPEFRLTKLLEIVEAELRGRIAKSAPPPDRYRQAMVERATAIARRCIDGGVDAPERALNRVLLRREEASLEVLATSIRARSIDDETHPDLLARLRDYVRERAGRWNPDLL